MELLNVEGLLGQLSIAALFMVVVWRMNQAHAKTTGQMIEAQKDNSRWHAEVKRSADSAFVQALANRDTVLATITDQLSANATAIRAAADASTAIANRLVTVELKQTQADVLAGRMLTAIEANSRYTAESVAALRDMTTQLAPILQATRDTSTTVTALTSTIRETLTEMINVRQELAALGKRVTGYASRGDVTDLGVRIDHLTAMLTEALIEETAPPSDAPTTTTLH